jgi:uncharacterized Ntn-hydrolase superfamily protein/uncharacterized protein (DUF1499 family)
MKPNPTRTLITSTFCLLLGLAGACAEGVPTAPTVATYSIVAFDPKTGDLGVAVQSKFFGVGSVVPYAEAGVGAIATQAYANPEYGPKGLRMLRDGFSAEGAVHELTKTDASRDHRQLGMVDAQGDAAAYTGAKCNTWAGHYVGLFYTVQGNILAGESVIRRMSTAFETARKLPGTELADWLFESIKAGEAAGGDRRGRQSAALLVSRKGGGYAQANDRYIDLRVDDHVTPVEEIGRLLGLHKQFYARSHREIPVPNSIALIDNSISQERWGWPVFLLLLVGVGIMFAVSTNSPPAPQLGVVHGRLTPCGERINAVSSHEAASERRVAPFKMDQPLAEARAGMRERVMRLPRVKLVSESDDYLRFECRSLIFRFVDDLEFHFDEIEKSIHVRSGARCGFWDLGLNRRRLNELRQAMNKSSVGEPTPQPKPAVS